jgi:hypothetical protein
MGLDESGVRAMSRLAIGDIDELARLQRKILHLFVWIDQLLERERLHEQFDEHPDVNVREVTMRDALPGLLDDIAKAVREIAEIVNRDHEDTAK